MLTKEEWDRMFLNLVPVAFGASSLVLGLMMLTRSSPLGQRIYYQDGQCLVNVRYGKWHDLRDFIQPDNPDVLAIYHQYGPDYWALYDFVCKSVSYKREVGEMWQFPSETLTRGLGDCEDTSLLLCSLLRNFTDAKVALGNYQGYGHAWCQLDRQILETTYTSARPVPDPQNYCPYVCFHDQEVIELWPGALAEVFSLGRDEELKLNLMAQALEVT